MSFTLESFRLQLNRSREDLGGRNSLDSPTTSTKYRSSRLFQSVTGSDLTDDTDAQRQSKREKTKAILKKVFGGKQGEAKKASTSSYLSGPGLKESLSKRKAPNLTIAIMPKPPVPPVHKILPESAPSPLPPSPANSHESASLQSFGISPTSADFDPPIASFMASYSSDVVPSPSPSNSRPPSPHLPYLMQHLSASREALAKEESNSLPYGRQKSLSTPSLNDMYRAQTQQDLTKHRPAVPIASPASPATHTVDGIRIPQNFDDDDDDDDDDDELESDIEIESPRRRSVPASFFQFVRPKSPVRTGNRARPASYDAPKEKKHEGRSLSMAELAIALDGWDCEADAEEAHEHLVEMKKRAMESEERKRRSWDLAKDWDSWTPSPPVSAKKEVKWNF